MTEESKKGLWIGQIMANFKRSFKRPLDEPQIHFLLSNYELFHLWDDELVIGELEAR